MKKKQLVYDLPVRIFHWLFAGLFGAAFFIAKTVDDDAPAYAYHMLIGLTLSFLVLLRLIWGVAGTRYSRFEGFALSPKNFVGYFKGFLTGDQTRWAGHNPASSWAALVMMFFALGLGATGYRMTSGEDKEIFEDIHELFANGFLITAIAHVLGVLIHTVRHRELIGLSMVDGKKADVPADDLISSPKPAVAVGLLALISGFAVYLWNHYDSQTGVLHFFAGDLQLGEVEDKRDTGDGS